jgi:hypothetical protein
MEWGRGCRSKAMLEAARAFASSPVSLMRRLTDELTSDGKLTIGESPQAFARLSSSLWVADRKSEARRLARHERFSV